MGLRWRDLEDPAGSGTDWGDVLAVIECAPWDSPIRRAVSEEWPWGDPSRDLLAGIIDELRALRAQVAGLFSSRPTRMPERIPRPGHASGRIETGEATVEEIDKLFGW